MATEYKTVAGDTWDKIAKEVYGNEAYTSFLMSKNQRHLNHFVFPDGVTLAIEDIPEMESSLPSWRV